MKKFLRKAIGDQDNFYLVWRLGEKLNLFTIAIEANALSGIGFTICA